MNHALNASDVSQAVYSVALFSWRVIESLARLAIDLLKVVSWPLVAVGFICLFRSDIRLLLKKLRDVKWLKAGENAAEFFSPENLSKQVTDVQSIVNSAMSVDSKAVDVDGDGVAELIVVSQDGPYWSTLRLYRFGSRDDSPHRIPEFVEIAKYSGILNWKIKERLNANPAIIIEVDDPDSGLPHAACTSVLEQTLVWTKDRLTVVGETHTQKPITTYDMLASAASEIESLEKEKNELTSEIYKRLESNQDAQNLSADADDAFNAYAKAESDWHYKLYEGGTVKGVVGAKVVKRLLTERIKLLRDWLSKKEGEMW